MDASNLDRAVFGDANLLFAVLALQRGFLDQGKFVDACAAWAARRDTPLPDLLLQRHWLAPDDRSQLEQDMDRLLKKHQGDVRSSLVEAADDPAVRQSLARVFADPELENLSGADAILTEVRQVRQSRQRYVLAGQPKMGGIGQVWRARDTHLGREVALKELRQDRVRHAELRERFLAEAQVTAQLTHPNLFVRMNCGLVNAFAANLE